MAKAIVEIYLPEITRKEILSNPDWLQDGKIVIDESYLTRNNEDDSFFNFDIVSILDD